MNSSRRKVLKGTGGAAVMGLAMSAGLLRSEAAFAQSWNKAAFETKSFNDTVKAMGGSAAAESKDIAIVSPDGRVSKKKSARSRRARSATASRTPAHPARARRGGAAR